MMQFIKNHGLFFLFIAIALFFRFYNLTWGSPFYFHPDERQNVVYPVVLSHSFFMLDQKDFDNGTFPLIVIKLIFSLITSLFHFTIDPSVIGIIISRSLSALISLVILVLLFYVGKKIFGREKGYLAFAFATFSIGFIQFSHFGTIELWEALFFFLLFYYSWRIATYAHIIDGLICGIFLGLAMSTKILSIILIPAICFSFLFFFYHQLRAKNNLLKTIKKLLLVFFILSISAACSFFITFSQIVTNFQTVYGSIHFESDVALGKTAVFYTQGFFHSIPIIYQFTRVYPFLLNPIITILFAVGLFYVLFAGIVKKNYSYLLVSIFFLFIFVSQSFFFVKWTRYMIPTLPFIYMILAIAIDDWIQLAQQTFKHATYISYVLITFPIVSSFVFAAAFFITVYVHPASLIVASNVAKRVIPPNAAILSESFDLGSSAFNAYFPNISYFDFYDYNGGSREELANRLANTEYIILPSQRLVRTRLLDAKTFPAGHSFYAALFEGRLGFSLLYETPCDILCRLSYSNDPNFALEETVNVFDRPTVFIFKKTNMLSFNDYVSVLTPHL